MNHGQYDQGIELAERYHDFQLLVRLCERAGDRERLKSYVVRFAEEGFAEFLFKQHLDRGVCVCVCVCTCVCAHVDVCVNTFMHVHVHVYALYVPAIMA